MLPSFLAAGHAAPAQHASESAEVLAPANWLPGVTTLVVFLLAFAFLYWKVWPMITKGLDDREEKIRDEIASAEAARAQADAALKDYQESLASARTEAAAMISRAKADAKRAGEELRAKNDEQLAQMKFRATREIEAAKETAIAELHAEAAGLAASIAGKILQREITPADQERLVQESLEELAQAGRG